ncbi:V-type ATP synthase subunit F [Candidatus Bathycorpusculum sp.]|jgi:V/A-type H+-transporting ATPase subunit F|uniref:V-type ATP synthase subunit F n=1 Tax=Candidatus Bathycorpusculum sp. TaxID=2994959 RepID=UPI00282105D4|nr:V-type ATP synthase subunit F [Candidatus Termitimicrobium sp.]MCL2685258.1 V-type ATP synthase subunit F [Candidatus Termitimicrobium sp.]
MIGHVIGDSDMITGFKLVGIQGTEVTTVDEANQALSQALSNNTIALIILSETFAAEPTIRKQVDKIRQEQITPIILELPDSKGPQNNAKLSDTISKILGIKI